MNDWDQALTTYSMAKFWPFPALMSSSVVVVNVETSKYSHWKVLWLEKKTTEPYSIKPDTCVKKEKYGLASLIHNDSPQSCLKF